MRPIGRDGERDRVDTQTRGELGEVSQDDVSATVAGAGADEPDRPPRCREPVERPGIEVDRIGAVQDERLDVGGMARRVDRHQVGAVGGAPEIEPLQAERRPHRLDVVGCGGGAVEPGLRPELSAARADPREHLLLGKECRHHAAQCGAGQHARAAGAALIDKQHVTARADGVETRRVLRGGGEDRATRQHQRPERRPRDVATRHEREHDLRRSQPRVRPVERHAERAAARAGRCGWRYSSTRDPRNCARAVTRLRAARGGDGRDGGRGSESRDSDADQRVRFMVSSSCRHAHWTGG